MTDKARQVVHCIEDVSTSPETICGLKVVSRKALPGTNRPYPSLGNGEAVASIGIFTNLSGPELVRCPQCREKYSEVMDKLDGLLRFDALPNKNIVPSHLQEESDGLAYVPEAKNGSSIVTVRRTRWDWALTSLKNRIKGENSGEARNASDLLTIIEHLYKLAIMAEKIEQVRDLLVLNHMDPDFQLDKILKIVESVPKPSSTDRCPRCGEETTGMSLHSCQ